MGEACWGLQLGESAVAELQVMTVGAKLRSVELCLQLLQPCVPTPRVIDSKSCRPSQEMRPPQEHSLWCKLSRRFAHIADNGASLL